MPRVPPKLAGRSSFTLVELMIMVGILSLLLMMLMPTFINTRYEAQSQMFSYEVRQASGYFLQYSMDHPGYPADSTPGVIPAGMREYMRKFPWTKPTPLGGSWDWDCNVFGYLAGVSVYQPTFPLIRMRRVDQLVDDGVLTTGNFRQRPEGYISIIEF